MDESSPNIALERIGASEILNALADGAYITDADRKIVFWSQAAARMTGWQAADVVGHRCADNILVHVDKDGHQLCGEEYCPLHRSIVTGEMSSEPLLVFAQHKQGHRIPVEVSVSPIRDRDGRIVGGVEVFRDLTAMMHDLQSARRIQDQALESPLPADKRLTAQVRYTPQEIVGGDFYRMEPLDADRYAIMVADVMGHGVASALYTMQLRSLWEDCRDRLGSPAAFLGELNQRLGKLVSGAGYFATVVFAVLNAADGTLRYVRAGHPAPFLFRAGGDAKALDVPSPAVGLFEGATYVETEERLGPGDTLLMFTDGAIEISGARGEELGQEGFLRLLQGKDFGGGGVSLDAVEEMLLVHSGRIHLADDLTLLSIRRAADAAR